MGWHGDTGTVALARLCAVALGCLMLANCSSSSKLTSRVDPRYGVAASPRVVEPGPPARVGPRPAGAEGRRRLSRREALSGGGRHLHARREQPLPLRGPRLL